MNEAIEAKNKVKSCVFTFWDGTEVDFTAALNLPITYNTVLDETLDTAQIKLTDLRVKDYPSVDVTTAFEPNTLVTIKFEDKNGANQDTVLKMLISHDDCRLQRKDKTIWRSWQHSIQLIEQTKELERLSVDTLTFTNPVPREYDADTDAVWSVG